MDESIVKLSLSNFWRVLEDKSLNSCVHINKKNCNIQELVSLENCLHLTQKSQEINSHSKCRLDVKLSNLKNSAFSRFSILSEAKFIEVHVNECREYVELIKGELIESLDDINMFQAGYDFNVSPQFFSLTLIPKNSNSDRIFIFALSVETQDFINFFNPNLFSFPFEVNELESKLTALFSKIGLNLKEKNQIKKSINKDNIETVLESEFKSKDCKELKTYIDFKFDQFQKIILNQIEERFLRLENNLKKLFNR